MANILLCALTGFGNEAIGAIKNTGHKIVALCTRKESHSYPYYNCNSIEDLARENEIKVIYDLPNLDWLKANQIDVILCVTFHKIIPSEIISSVPNVLNVHPSLLPKYRGASPVFWKIYNNEKETGWTIHKITKEFDRGEIYTQCKMQIGAEDTQGELRFKMAQILGGILQDFLNEYPSSLVKKTVQDEAAASSYPRFDVEKHGQLNKDQKICDQLPHIRALLPWPGVKINGKMFYSYEDVLRHVNC